MSSHIGWITMLDRINLIRNIGQFDSVTDGATLPLPKLTLIYAENGRGKTTLSAILRSLGTGDAAPIAERKRLSATQPPHVVVKTADGATINFQGGAWTQTVPNLAVFDDVFVDENVYSGLSVEPGHRQKLHDIILGAQGVALANAFQAQADRNEEHITALRATAGAIPASARGTLDADAFCALEARPMVAEEIQTAERRLAAVRAQEPIRNGTSFQTLDLPAFDLASVEVLLAGDLTDLDMHAAALVQGHLASIGDGGEGWVADGMERVKSPDVSVCPFCAQDLTGSPLVAHYRAYFSEGYNALKRAIDQMIAGIDTAHGAAIATAFERSVRVWSEGRQFWSKFCDIPDVGIDTAAVARAWNKALDAVRARLLAKQAAPLERMAIDSGIREAVSAFDEWRMQVKILSDKFETVNTTIAVVKEQAAAGNPTAIAADIARMKVIVARQSPEVAPLCAAHLAEKAAKADTETRRTAARNALDHYRTTVFPTYETAINDYLGKFGAGFRLTKMASATTRAGPTCTYGISIGTNTIPVGGAATPGVPSFSSTMSAGDRNTLALAFFFASLNRDPELANKVVVIDDPMTSLDEHRHLTTVQEMGRLTQKSGQMIVLSHSKPFLCELWESADKSARAAIEIARHGDGSNFRGWVIHHDLMTEHDRRHALLREYLQSSVPDKRRVAEALRFVLEKFVRVAYPDYFAPGGTLGTFVSLSRQRIGAAQQILDAVRTQEIDDILTYANRFHHDTNHAYQTEAINDGALLDFVKRTLAITRH